VEVSPKRCSAPAISLAIEPWKDCRSPLVNAAIWTVRCSRTSCHFRTTRVMNAELNFRTSGRPLAWRHPRPCLGAASDMGNERSHGIERAARESDCHVAALRSSALEVYALGTCSLVGKRSKPRKAPGAPWVIELWAKHRKMSSGTKSSRAHLRAVTRLSISSRSNNRNAAALALRRRLTAPPRPSHPCHDTPPIVIEHRMARTPAPTALTEFATSPLSPRSQLLAGSPGFGHFAR
jgi:hypothetical protein